MPKARALVVSQFHDMQFHNEVDVTDDGTADRSGNLTLRCATETVSVIEVPAGWL